MEFLYFVILSFVLINFNTFTKKRELNIDENNLRNAQLMK
jgi:hypothetical protein